MDCLRSFNIGINQSGSFAGGLVTKTWLSGTETFWASRISGTSTFTFQGFKNVDLYGIDVIGAVTTQVGALIGGVNVNDWAMELVINGQYPLASGFVTVSPNFWNVQLPTTSDRFELSKNTNSLKFENPIKSVSTITFESLNTQGNGAETSGTVSLDYDLTFVIYYKYEGE